MVTPMAPSKDVLSFGPFRLAPSERLLTRAGTPVELGARALDILIALVLRPNEVITKKELLSLVWPGVTVEEYSLRFHLANLRKALGDGKDGARYITTLAGRGYCFVAPVTRSREEVEAAAPVATDFSYANLPGRLALMVGRDEDVLLISKHLIAARFVSIVGAGGVGKTTVAIAVGHHLIEAFKGEVLVVDLSVLSDPGLVATAIAALLGLSVQSEDATPTLIAFLRGKRMLLILDTCEHLIDAVAALTSKIYVEAPDVHILATSREILQVEGEHVYRLDTLTCPPEGAEVLSAAAQTFPAPRLFIQRAAASDARMDLGDAEVAAIVRICRKLDGVALAIELAARRVEAYGLYQTENLLDQHLAFVLLSHRSATPRQRTLQAALDWSYQLLSELERAVLRRLAVFVGNFTLDAALEVITDTAIDQSQVLSALDNLVAKSMVATRPIGALMRYRLLDTTRAYVLNIATDNAEAAGLAARHATYYRRWLDQSGSNWPTLSTGSERSPHFSALNNARHALEWCFGEGGDVQLGIKLAAAAAPVFLTMSLLRECCLWSERAIAALDDATSDGAEEMQLQACLGVASLHIHGPSEAALAALNRSLMIAEARGDVLSQVMMLWTLSLFCVRQAEFKIALEYAKRAGAVARTTEEPDAAALAQSALGRALHFVGDYTGARAELEAALQYWSSTRRTYLGIDERIQTSVVLMRTLWAQGFPAQAVERARQTLDDAKLSSNPVTLAVTLSWVPGILIWAGDYQSAAEHVNWLIPYAESHSLSPNLHVGRAYKGTLAIYSGNPAAGVQTLQDCLKHLHARNTASNRFLHQRKVEFNIALTQGLITIGRVDEGIALIDETMSRVEENGELYLLPEVLRIKGCAILASSEHRVDQAEACFSQSLELSRRQGARAWELRTAIDLARLLANRGRPGDGRKLLQPILEQFTEGRDTADHRTAERLLRELGRDQ
ncbi:winged helix-turn-helix domain-containing protein [Bradyrhizobium uaiense]|uniref:Transcriptional regulator n=1 Tax=Bradyrhizobium uaiense TaxID=2594946 RepID=A0A6P1BFA1_9BRAD|nr:winged helix-turn-helix domain-containing protein [Bradyrhizobium uaiense]NEU97118.1 transcriptional regulator [Bradyrhizobium uaiense]